MCGQVVCVRKLCVSQLCVSKLCVSTLCVDKLCAGKLCVSKLSVGGGGRQEEAGGSAQPKTRTPHKDVGKKQEKPEISPGVLKSDRFLWCRHHPLRSTSRSNESGNT